MRLAVQTKAELVIVTSKFGAGPLLQKNKKKKGI